MSINPPKVLLFGPENAGKTTLLYQFKYSEFISTIPTFSCNCETIFFNDHPMIFWDVGSLAPIHQFHQKYLKDTSVLVFVLDASDFERIGNARQMLWKVTEEIEMEDLPLIIIGNKSDEANVMETEEIIEKLGLNYRTDWKWQIVMTSAAKREGIDEALKCIHMCLYFQNTNNTLSYQ
ncbi:hypothetical protein PVAND_016802 [Polypedilum vanderplanki]|uniref:small monomeric GTPase n=1 Tax=Polypedilum vanderplanki TaxID=319348 RepID=A0A9J6BGQ0_POLVA|nr:hypothetical protein PVAND_016802 [Polypedilum vanderplanki]